MTETRLQQELMAWLKREHPDAHAHTFHVPNGGGRSKAQGHNLKLMGVKSGVPDLLCILPNGNHKGLALELKIGKGRLSDSQVEWLDRFDSQGWYACSATGMEQAKLAFEIYLGKTA